MQSKPHSSTACKALQSNPSTTNSNSWLHNNLKSSKESEKQRGRISNKVIELDHNERNGQVDTLTNYSTTIIDSLPHYQIEHIP